MSEITINEDQELYVFKSGSGYSCLGFDYTFRQACGIADAIASRRPDLAEFARDQKPDPEDYGTISVYNAYRNMTSLLSREKIDLGTWYDPNTDPHVRDILEAARASGQRLRIWYGDAETGVAWGDKPVAGEIGRSMGPLKIPLVISNRRSLGGVGLLSASIVKICETPGNRLVWQHPSFTEVPSAPKISA